MKKRSQSAIPAFALAAISLVLAVVTGLEWVGKPLRLVHLVMIIGLSVATGVALMQAVAHARGTASTDAAEPELTPKA